MIVLTVKQRESLLKLLETAPDSILIEAVKEIKQQRIYIQEGFKAVKGYMGFEAMKLEALDGATISVAKKLDTEPLPLPVTKFVEPEPKNDRPPGVACSRAGKETVDKIKAACMKGATCGDVNKALGRGNGKAGETESILKLLWERKTLSYSNGVYRSTS